MSDIQISEPVGKIINKYPDLGEIIHFGYELLKELRQIQPDLDLSSLKLNHELTKMKMKEGFPFLEKSKIDIPSDQFKEVFNRVAIFISEKRKPLKPKIIEISEKIKTENIDILKLALMNIRENIGITENTKAQKGKQSILNMLIRISLKPFGHAYGIALKEYLLSSEIFWLQSYCPVCGSMPLVAYLEGEEGRRHLLCSWCDTSWIFPRIKCTYCQNTDQKSLKYFSLEEEKGIKEKDRVSVCQKCMKYIKTIDTRKFTGEKESDLQIEDLTTLHLDLLAEREGYERITRRFLFF